MQKLAQRLDWHTVRKVKKGAITLTAVALCLISFVRAQVPVPQQDDPPSSSLSRQLSDLQMAPAGQAAIARAIHVHDYAAAEKILLKEVERDPKSPRSAKALAIVAGVCFAARVAGDFAHRTPWPAGDGGGALGRRRLGAAAVTAAVEPRPRAWNASRLTSCSWVPPPGSGVGARGSGAGSSSRATVRR